MSAPLQILELGPQLERLESLLSASGAGVYRLLAQGLNVAATRARLLERGLTPPGELATWFQWHNGLTLEHPESFGDGVMGVWSPLSLDQALDEWARRERGEEPWQWSPDWLPIATKGRRYLAVRCDRDQELAVVRAVGDEFGLFSEEAAEVIGLGTVVSWWCDALESGVYAYERDSDAWSFGRWAELPLNQRLTGLI